MVKRHFFCEFRTVGKFLWICNKFLMVLEVIELDLWLLGRWWLLWSRFHAGCLKSAYSQWTLLIVQNQLKHLNFNYHRRPRNRWNEHPYKHNAFPHQKVHREIKLPVPIFLKCRKLIAATLLGRNSFLVGRNSGIHFTLFSHNVV